MMKNQIANNKKPATSGIGCLFGFWLPSWFSYWVHKLFNWNFFVVVEKSIPSSPTNFTSPRRFVDVGIFWCKFVTIFAMCLGSFFLRMSFYSFHNICSGIKRLLASCGPSAILRGVWAIVVNSINRHSWRPITHISVKGFERISPFVAYVNSSAAIIFPIFCVWICAALDHGGPSVVDRLKSFISHMYSSNDGVHIVNQFNGECNG